MKNLFLIVAVLVATQSQISLAGSGSAIGNGFTAQSVLGTASLAKSKTNEKLCADAGGTIAKEGAEEVCKVKDQTIKMKDLVEAAKKNDSGKK
jgi:hypothetical protein